MMYDEEDDVFIDDEELDYRVIDGMIVEDY